MHFDENVYQVSDKFQGTIYLPDTLDVLVVEQCYTWVFARLCNVVWDIKVARSPELDWAVNIESRDACVLAVHFQSRASTNKSPTHKMFRTPGRSTLAIGPIHPTFKSTRASFA